jgi:hypothetical protein
MARMTEEEAAYWDEYYTKNPPKPGPNGTGLYTQRKVALAAQAAECDTETCTITVDKFTADYLLTKAMTTHKTPADIIGEMVRKQITDKSA